MIEKFVGKYRFLSNFHPAVVMLGGLPYPSVEHAYQAAKTEDSKAREQIRKATSPGAAKKLGRKLATLDKKEWDKVKERVMLDLLRQKFSHGSMLATLLLSTRDTKLIEGNHWGDVYWGVCNGKGKNRLGVLLMKVRAELACQYGVQLTAQGE